jgi:hypothetical protein
VSKKSHQRKPKYKSGVGATVSKQPAGGIDRAKGVAPSPPLRVVSPDHQQSHAGRDYSYVSHDLKFTGILAGSLVLLIVILSFVLG